MTANRGVVHLTFARTLTRGRHSMRFARDPLLQASTSAHPSSSQRESSPTRSNDSISLSLSLFNCKLYYLHYGKYKCIIYYLISVCLHLAFDLRIVVVKKRKETHFLFLSGPLCTRARIHTHTYTHAYIERRGLYRAAAVKSAVAACVIVILRHLFGTKSSRWPRRLKRFRTKRR